MLNLLSFLGKKVIDHQWVMNFHSLWKKVFAEKVSDIFQEILVRSIILLYVCTRSTRCHRVLCWSIKKKTRDQAP